MAKSVCTGCNETFTSVGAFDMHRVGGYGDPIYQSSSNGRSRWVVGYTPSTRRCLTVEEMVAKGMTQTAKGWWSTGTFDFVRTSSKDEPDEFPTPDDDELEEESA